jgi:hypothetical protein
MRLSIVHKVDISQVPKQTKDCKSGIAFLGEASITCQAADG